MIQGNQNLTSYSGTLTTTGVGTGTYITSPGFIGYNQVEKYPKSSFDEYRNKIKDSERLGKTLDLFKKGELTKEEALDFIANDIQFHKKELVPDYPQQYITYNSPNTVLCNNGASVI